MTKREALRRTKLEAEWNKLALDSILLELESYGFGQGYGEEYDGRDQKDAKHLREWIVANFTRAPNNGT